ncbi:hypothetical protein GCK32_015622 [Trichostrongylus colubriformis]|uniref:Uncharacterized protein n=1 Tax=Trichostrongylus colubriformis TaxID=6319 RepID=A0AAN8IKM5_TRICO
MAKPSLHARSFFRSSYYAANRRTVWAACRAVIFGCIVIAIGLAMTVLGYFDKQFSERIEIIDGEVNIYHDRVVQYQLKSMQYLGPILMGIGSFILIIACVVTLESRDKHAQVITEESMSCKKRRMMSIEERAELSMNEIGPEDETPITPMVENQTTSISTLAEVHLLHPAASRTAPLAEIDSLDLHSCSSQVTTDREVTAEYSETKEV